MKYFLIIAGIVIYNIAMSQSASISVYSLDEDKMDTPLRNNFYLKSFTNVGDIKHEATEEHINKYLVERDKEKATKWLYDDFFKPAASEEEASVIITGTYKYTRGTEVEERLFHEKTGNPRLPYYNQIKKNKAELCVVLNYEYKDGSPAFSDTILLKKSSEIIPGKKSPSLVELEERISTGIASAIRNLDNVKDYKKDNLNFPKVKIKDKALKEEYSELKGLLKAKEYEKAGALCKKVHAAVQKPESAQALALCYELVGNIPKAEQYYKGNKDFAINVRLKNYNKLLNYVRSIGYEPEFVDF